jgi:hypothetical protein
VSDILELPAQCRWSWGELDIAVHSGKIAPSWHRLICRWSNQVEDQLGLVQVGAARQNRLAFEHLAKDTTDAPHIDSSRVAAKLEK